MTLRLFLSLTFGAIFISSTLAQSSKFVRFSPLEISVLVESRDNTGDFGWMDLGILNWSDEPCTGCVHYETVSPSSSVRLTVFDHFSVLTVNSIDGQFEVRFQEQPVSGINSFNKVYRAANEIWGGQSYTEESELVYRSMIISTGW